MSVSEFNCNFSIQRMVLFVCCGSVDKLCDLLFTVNSKVLTTFGSQFIVVGENKALFGSPC